VNFIGSKLKAIRLERKWTLLDVEEMTGIRQSTLSKIENNDVNKENPRRSTVENLCQLFKIDESYFYMDNSRLLSDIFPFMTDDMQTFLANSENTPYVILSEKAKRKGISPETLEKLIDLMESKK